MREVFIVNGVRTAIGNFRGSPAPLGAADLGAAVAAEVLRRSGLQDAAKQEFVDVPRLQAAAPEDFRGDRGAEVGRTEGGQTPLEVANGCPHPVDDENLAHDLSPVGIILERRSPALAGRPVVPHSV